LGVAPGWAVARLGCFAVHDHPGVLTDFFLAVKFPEGARHDLGLYDAPWVFAITGILYAFRPGGVLQGRLLPFFGIRYAVVRFGFDFLRAYDLSYRDARYGGLTPAQYACFGLVLYGLWGLWKYRPLSASLPSAARVPASAAGRRAST